jgi:hypothetical protein
MKAKCQICDEFYAEVDLKTLRYPLAGSMFGSPDPVHGFDAPFDPSIEWEYMRCPYGRMHRPMVNDDAVLTEKGLVRLPRDGSPAYIDKDSTGEVDRSCIVDRAIQVPDDVAERMARSALTIKSETPIKGIHLYEVKIDPDKSAFICAACGKSFDTKRQLMGHKGGAHRKAKQAVKSKSKRR